MNQWTNWLKVHYQYDLPESRWSRLVPQNWRNRINKHRVAQNKDLINYDSYDKTRLILYKNENEQVDLLNFQKKIKKQYRYDRSSSSYSGNFWTSIKGFFENHRGSGMNLRFLN